MDNIAEFLEELARFKRYSTPFSVVTFKLVFLNKNEEINYFNTVLFNLRLFFEKHKRKLDILDRYKSLIVMGLRETPVDKVKGFLDRFYNTLDSYLKDYILQSRAGKDEVKIVDVKLNIYLVSLEAKNIDNIILISEVSENGFISVLENINSLEEKIFEVWKVSFPIIEE